MRAFIAYREDLIIAAYNDTEGQDSKWYMVWIKKQR